MSYKCAKQRTFATEFPRRGINCYEGPNSTLNFINLCQRVLEQLCNSKRISSRAHSRLVAQFNDVMTVVGASQDME